jgi:acyl-CoA hydrolase
MYSADRYGEGGEEQESSADKMKNVGGGKGKFLWRIFTWSMLFRSLLSLRQFQCPSWRGLSTRAAVALPVQEAIKALPLCMHIFGSFGLPVSIMDNRVYEKVPNAELVSLKPEEPRTVDHSWVRWDLPLRSNQQLKEQFTLFSSDRVRIGKILELLDAFSADVAYRHVGQNLNDYAIVTACLDRLDFFDKLTLEEDLRVEGFLTRVGNSAMDVRVDLYGEKTGYFGKADFLLVAREKKKNAAKSVPTLLLETDGQKEMERIASFSREMKKKHAQTSVWKTPPSGDESRIIHGLFRQYRELGEEEKSTYVCMNETAISKSLIMQAQFRNIHNKSKWLFSAREKYVLISNF